MSRVTSSQTPTRVSLRNDSGVSQWGWPATGVGTPVVVLSGIPLPVASSNPPLALSPCSTPCVSSSSPLTPVVVASPVTPRRAHPETDDKVHPATPAYTARSSSTYARRYPRERMSRVGIDIRRLEGKGGRGGKRRETTNRAPRYHAR